VLAELKKQKEANRPEYENFWNNFGSAMKEGLCEAIPEAEKLLDICMFYSVLHSKMITLEEYVQNFVANQNQIYYISGDNIEKLKSSPQIEGFKKQNIDVLLFTDTVDDFWVNIINKYKEHDLKSVTRSDIDLKKYDSLEKEEDSQQHEGIVDYFKTVLGDAVKDVKISKRLESIPACLVVEEGSMDIRMERFLIEQKQIASSSAKILEINPYHGIIQKLEQDIANGKLDGDSSELAKLVYDQACIIENEPLLDPAEFCRRLNKFIHLQ
jgi:molecular chaperone HtpG